MSNALRVAPQAADACELDRLYSKIRYAIARTVLADPCTMQQLATVLRTMADDVESSDDGQWPLGFIP